MLKHKQNWDGENEGKGINQGEKQEHSLCLENSEETNVVGAGSEQCSFKEVFADTAVGHQGCIAQMPS